MKIADLWVGLGIKGDGEAQKALTGVRGTLGEISTSGLAAKAGILGAVYALKGFMEHGMDAGATLMSFSNATGMSIDNLQRWQWAARHANVSAEEMESTITGLQGTMMKVSMGQANPAGMGIMMQAVHGDFKRIRDTKYMFEKINEYLAKEKNIDFANQVAQSMGYSMNMIAAARSGVFNPKMLASAPVLSGSDVQSLQAAKNAWGDLYAKIQMSIDKMNSKHGLALVRDISKMTTELLKMADVLIVVSEKLKVFEVIGTVFDGLTKSLRLINGESVDQVMKGDTKKKHFGDNTWWMNAVNKAEDAFLNRPTAKEIMTGDWPGDKKQAPNVTHNHTNHIHGATDPAAVAKEVQKHFKRNNNAAARQSNALNQDN